MGNQIPEDAQVAIEDAVRRNPNSVSAPEGGSARPGDSCPATHFPISPRAPRRKPVGYNHKFLDRYRPNSSSYLTERDRPQIPEQPAGTYTKQILNRLLIDLARNSSRPEGNTYSLLEQIRKDHYSCRCRRIARLFSAKLSSR